MARNTQTFNPTPCLANAAVLMALASPGDRILGLSLAHGGHLTHGMKLNFSGRMYEGHSYELDPETHLIDMETVRQRAIEVKPAVLIAGWSAYSRQLDFASFRQSPMRLAPSCGWTWLTSQALLLPEFTQAQFLTPM